MFRFLKDKLKGAIDKFKKGVEEEAPEEEVVVEKEVKVEKPKVEKKKPEQKKPEPKKSDKKPEEKSKERKPERGEKKKEKKPLKKPEPKPPKVKEEQPKVEAKAAPVKDVKVEKPKVEKKPEPIPKPQVKGEEQVIEKKEEPVQEPPQKKGFFSKLKETFTGPAKPVEEQASHVEKEEPAVKKEEHTVKSSPEPEAKGFFQKISQRITTKKITSEQFDELFWELELALLENNVAIEVIEKIKNDLKGSLVDKPIPRNKVEEVIASSLQGSISDLFMVPDIDLLKMSEEKKPLVVAFVGINGSGKTTSIAKVTRYLLDNNKSVVLAAADTFRAAAIDQLQLHADKLGVKMIRHDYGSDPAAVAFDAVAHAKAAKKDIVLIDTAGRLHSNINLVDEMKKIVRVAKPDLKIFVGESITGNDCVEQAQKFDEAVGIDGIILSKADVDEKGGAAISVSYVTKKPILFLGMGQEYEDLQPFSKEKLLESIGL